MRAEDDGAVLPMVGSGPGMAIMPALSLTQVPPGLRVTDLGPERPTRRIGYVTRAELATTAAVRTLVRELRALCETAAQRRVTDRTVSDSRKSE